LPFPLGEHELLDEYGNVDSARRGDEHEDGQSLVHVSHLTVTFLANHGFAKLVGDVARHGDGAGNTQVHHSRGHEKRSTGADETTQDSADESQHDHLDCNDEIYFNELSSG
jgi:hypothetical protein